MLCDNCGKREANVRYQENINGQIRELNLCEECSRKLGIGQMDFSMPIDLSSFLGGFLDDFMEPEFMPMLNQIKTIRCDTCGSTFDDILNTGTLGCKDCYDTFQDKLDPIIKKIQGSNRHVGRLAKEIDSKIDSKNKTQVKGNEKQKNNEEDKEQNEAKGKIEKLQQDLKQAIKEERYEDAAKIRDEIKKLEK